MDLITEVDILDEARDCFLTYSSEVLTDRAIPNAEDGLLSAQRKVLWTMNSVLKMDAKSKTKKSNAIVGSSLATAYYHGDAACYDVLRKMSLDYLMRYPLVIGQGQLGSQESNDLYSSSRYSEAKPSPFADLMFIDFNKNTVPLKETYNNEYYEPVYLPALFPNAICNGREAIGVSMSHNSLPHNLSEVCDAAIAQLNKGEPLTIDELLACIKGPDFPLPNIVINSNDIRNAFETGKSTNSLKVRGIYNIEKDKIIFTSIPYRTYRDKIKEQIEKNIDELEKYIDDFSDESNLGQNKLIFNVKRGVAPEKAVDALFAYTDLQTTLSYNMTYIVNGTPRLVSMMELIDIYVKHQERVLINATIYDKEKAEKRLHILKGLVAAVEKINEVVETIKTAEGKDEAKAALFLLLSIDDVQANAILDMRLGALTKLDKDKLTQEKKEKEDFIMKCEDILNSGKTRVKILINKITKLKEEFGDARRTVLLQLNENLAARSLKQEEEIRDCTVNIADSGLVKFNAKKGSFRYSFNTNTGDVLLSFAPDGRSFKDIVGKLKENSEVGNLLTISLEAYSPKYLLFITKGGQVKKMELNDAYTESNNRALKVIGLAENDEVVSVLKINGDEDVFLITREGMSIRFNIGGISPATRTSKGVKGINLKENDEVVGGVIVNGETVKVETHSGSIKSISFANFKTQNRGGKGNKCSDEKIKDIK